MKAGLPRAQKGAAAIEFAVVFLLFFAVFYGIVAYSLPLLVMQTLTRATAEAVRQTVAIDPSTSGTGYAALVKSTATSAAVDAANKGLLRTLSFSASYVTVTYTGANTLLTVTINYPSANINAVLPFVTVPGIGRIPNLPTLLTAQSSMLL